MDVIKVLRGLVLNPLVVAFARGMLEAAAMAAIVFGIDWAMSDQVPEALKLWVPMITLGLRQLEGLADKIDPAKQRRRDVLRESPVTDEDGNPMSSTDLGEPV